MYIEKKILKKSITFSDFVFLENKDIFKFYSCYNPEKAKKNYILIKCNNRPYISFFKSLENKIQTLSSFQEQITLIDILNFALEIDKEAAPFVLGTKKIKHCQEIPYIAQRINSKLDQLLDHVKCDALMIQNSYQAAYYFKNKLEQNNPKVIIHFDYTSHGIYDQMIAHIEQNILVPLYKKLAINASESIQSLNILAQITMLNPSSENIAQLKRLILKTVLKNNTPQDELEKLVNMYNTIGQKKYIGIFSAFLKLIDNFEEISLFDRKIHPLTASAIG